MTLRSFYKKGGDGSGADEFKVKKKSIPPLAEK
jgi:hypothetical protein